jgi:integrase
MIEQQKNGRYKVTVQRPAAGGKRQRVCRTVDTLDAAERLETQLRARPGSADEQTVSTALDRYLRLHGPAMAPNTERAYQYAARMANGWLGDVRLDHVDVDALETYYEQLQHGTHAPNGTTYTYRTVRQFAGLVKRALADVVRAKWITPEQYQGARVIGREGGPVLDDYDLDDVRRALASAAGFRKPDLDLADVVTLALATGARKGELAAIRWRDVDLDTGVVRIVANVSRARVGASGWVRREPKTRTGRRTVVVGDACLAMLNRRFVEQTVAAEAAGVDTLDDRVVLSRALERGYTSPQRLGERWERACKAAGVSLRFHDLRHVNTSELVAAGVPVVNVAARNGWRSAQMLHDVYAHARPAVDALACSTVDAVLARAVPRQTT